MQAKHDRQPASLDERNGKIGSHTDAGVAVGMCRRARVFGNILHDHWLSGP